MANRSGVINTDELVAKFQGLSTGASENLGKIVLAGAYILETEIKIDMTRQKTGRVYGVPRTVTRGVYKSVSDFDGSQFRAKVGEKKVKVIRKHQASAPGESPAVDYGALINSIDTRLDEESATRASALTGTNSEYAEPLEFGTSRMKARPFMRPGADRSKEKIERVMRDMLKRSLEEAANAG